MRGQATDLAPWPSRLRSWLRFERFLIHALADFLRPVGGFYGSVRTNSRLATQS
jgi:hypothetical protein